MKLFQCTNTGCFRCCRFEMTNNNPSFPPRHCPVDGAMIEIAEIHSPQFYSNDLRMMLDGLIVDVFRVAKAHGWHEADRNDGECLALMHSELSEALEALRRGIKKDEHCPQFSNLEIELADCIIRILDYAAMRDLNIAGAIIAKHEYNKTRPFKHGGKKF